MATPVDIVLDLGVPVVSCGIVIPSVCVLVVEDGVGFPSDSS